MMVDRKLNELTREEFLAIPDREHWAEPVECNSLVIIGMDEKHESGYRSIRAVACMNDTPICTVTTFSDVINIEGIGGFGYNTEGRCREKIYPAGFSIDCLPTSGLFRIFCSSDSRIMVCGASLSNFELFSSENYNRNVSEKPTEKIVTTTCERTIKMRFHTLSFGDDEEEPK